MVYSLNLMYLRTRAAERLHEPRESPDKRRGEVQTETPMQPGERLGARGKGRGCHLFILEFNSYQSATSDIDYAIYFALTHYRTYSSLVCL